MLAVTEAARAVLTTSPTVTTAVHRELAAALDAFNDTRAEEDSVSWGSVSTRRSRWCGSEREPSIREIAEGIGAGDLAASISRDWSSAHRRQRREGVKLLRCDVLTLLELCSTARAE